MKSDRRAPPTVSPAQSWPITEGGLRDAFEAACVCRFKSDLNLQFLVKLSSDVKHQWWSQWVRVQPQASDSGIDVMLTVVMETVSGQCCDMCMLSWQHWRTVMWVLNSVLWDVTCLWSDDLSQTDGGGADGSRCSSITSTTTNRTSRGTAQHGLNDVIWSKLH